MDKPRVSIIRLSFLNDIDKVLPRLPAGFGRQDNLFDVEGVPDLGDPLVVRVGQVEEDHRGHGVREGVERERQLEQSIA